MAEYCEISMAKSWKRGGHAPLVSMLDAALYLKMFTHVPEIPHISEHLLQGIDMVRCGALIK